MRCSLSFIVIASALLWPPLIIHATAAETVIGDGLAKDCEKAATYAADYSTVERSAMGVCNKAITAQAMSIHDLAATYVNRGILSLVKGDYDTAEADFSAAISAMPSLGGAYSNRGAAFVAQHRWADGITEITRGLALSTPEPERCYFNRGIAREAAGDIKGAYLDLQTAAQLKPDWDKPRLELTRFKVVSREY